MPPKRKSDAVSYDSTGASSSKNQTVAVTTSSSSFNKSSTHLISQNQQLLFQASSSSSSTSSSVAASTSSATRAATKTTAVAASTTKTKPITKLKSTANAKTEINSVRTVAAVSQNAGVSGQIDTSQTKKRKDRVKKLPDDYPESLSFLNAKKGKGVSKKLPEWFITPEAWVALDKKGKATFVKADRNRFRNEQKRANEMEERVTRFEANVKPLAKKPTSKGNVGAKLISKAATTDVAAQGLLTGTAPIGTGLRSRSENKKSVGAVAVSLPLAESSTLSSSVGKTTETFSTKQRDMTQDLMKRAFALSEEDFCVDSFNY